MSTAQRQSPRVVGPASELEPGNQTCTCCDRRLNGKVAWLELDQRTDTYHDHGGVPDDQSQGWFPFGLTCARKELARAALAKADPTTED